jgi:hypothetical protein
LFVNFLEYTLIVGCNLQLSEKFIFFGKLYNKQKTALTVGAVGISDELS